MASSNRHWPSMFKSKPAQWQHEMNSSLLSNGYHRTSYAPGIGCEERTPEPKPRWNPKPEQIRILESIFNSGMVNPPRDEIKKIRAQLQEYGQVGDANVFYWFQNRKSRSKHKQRQPVQNSGKSQPKQTTSTAVQPPPPSSITTIINNNTTGQSSSSSSSDKSSSFNGTCSNEKMISTTQHLHHLLPAVGSSIATDYLSSPTASVNQSPLFLISSASSEFLNEPSSFIHPHYAAQQNNIGGFCFPDMSRATVATDHNTVGNCSNFLLSELMLMNSCPSKKRDDDEEQMKLEGQLSNSAVPNSMARLIDDSVPTIPSPINQIVHGESKHGPTNESTAMVFINGVCFEVGCGPFNVRETFGDDVMLMQSTGQPVLTDEWGFTVQPLQSGGSYCLLMRPSSTIDLM